VPRAQSAIGERETDEPRRGAVTPRALAAAMALLALLAVGGFYAELLYPVPLPGLRFTSGVPPAAPFAALFLLTAAAGCRLTPRWLALTRRELLAVFIIVLAGSPLVSFGILGYLLPHAIYVQYAAAVHPEWSSTVLPLLPGWFSPTDPAAVKAFFEGKSAVPWSRWWTPLAAWCSFLLALVVASGSLALLLQRQWITRERLSFPLAQVPLEMVATRDTPRGARGRLPVSEAFWIGLVISFALPFWNNLAQVFTALPRLPLGPVPLLTAPSTSPTAAFGDLNLVLWPWLIAIAYLIPKELSLSCWVFWVLRVLLAYLAICWGAPPRSAQGWLGDPEFPAFAFQGFGAILALSAWALWRARRHLAQAARVALGRAGAGADASEPVPYRWAFAGLALGVAWMVAFCCLAGARLWVSLGLVGLILAYYLMWTWLRAETGLGLLMFPLFIDDLVRGVGTAALLRREIAVLTQLRWSYFPGAGASAQIATGDLLDGMKIAESARLRSRPLVAAIAAGLLLSLVIGVYVILTGTYHYGFFGLQATSGTWLASQVTWGAEAIPVALSEPSRLDARSVEGIAAGAIIAAALGWLRLRFLWWPLHPVGFLAANSWGMHWYSMPFFVGWLAKSLVTRYGGLRVYRKTVPLAVGLLVGDLVNQLVWALYRVAVHGNIG
jgi:hypothetical protein